MLAVQSSDGQNGCVFGDMLSRASPELVDNCLAILEECAADGADVTQMIDKLATRCVGVPVGGEEGARMCGTAYCYQHHGRCSVMKPAEPSAKVLRVCIAGVCCQPWSSMGKKAEWQHMEGTQCMMQWLHEMKLALPDVIIVECTPHFQHQHLRTIMEDSYQLAVLQISPELLGFPVKRVRKFMILTKSATTKMDTEVEVAGVDATFKRLFAHRVVARGSFFWRAPEPAVKSYIERCATARSLPVKKRGRDGALKSWSGFQVLGPGAQARLKGYEAKMSSLPGGRKSDVIVNIGQHPSHFKSLHSLVPTLLRRSALWCGAKGRKMMPAEALEVMGQRVFDDVGIDANSDHGPDGDGGSHGDSDTHGACPEAAQARPAAAPLFACPFRDLVLDGSLTDSQVQGMSGNAIHLGVMYAVQLFVYACVVKMA